MTGKTFYNQGEVVRVRLPYQDENGILKNSKKHKRTANVQGIKRENVFNIQLKYG